ncbi:hypothetical protein H5410_054413 [Solanum commersonii]|uniref:Uncharacterized protein n=1 Tax=Solanum commersonii TaxID=4109 RepID=A0A9J5WFZ7_SOLCO|nr:hypothetical protein H5410_054413 [Solanum commersonii]
MKSLESPRSSNLSHGEVRAVTIPRNNARWCIDSPSYSFTVTSTGIRIDIFIKMGLMQHQIVFNSRILLKIGKMNSSKE